MTIAITSLFNRTVEIGRITFRPSSPLASVVEEAYWQDSGEPLDDDDLYELIDHLEATGELETLWMDRLIERSEP